jgi:hypothetical protein
MPANCSFEGEIPGVTLPSGGDGGAGATEDDVWLPLPEASMLVTRLALKQGKL